MLVRFYRWLMAEPSDGICKNCSLLEGLLDDSRIENDKLLKQIIELSRPQYSVPKETVKEVDLTQVKQGPIPWRVRQQMLEENDRAAAKVLRDRQEEIEKLERELKLNQASQTEKEDAG